MLKEKAPPTVAEAEAAREIEGRYGPQVALCNQCKRCTSGCPVAEVMDIRPNQMVRLVGLGATHRLLTGEAIWTCAGCYQCTTRCPQGVPVAELVYALKGQALKRDLAPKGRPVPAFIRAFSATVERSGRSHEPEMLARFFLATSPREALRQAPAGLKLLRQGRLPLWGHKVKARKLVRAMLRKARCLGGTA